MADKSATMISEFSGEEVNTWSGEWRHECEVRAVLGMSKDDPDAYFNGVPGDLHQRGIVEIRGQEAADRGFEDVKRVKAIREHRK